MPTFSVLIEELGQCETVEISAERVDFIGFSDEHVFAEFVDSDGKTKQLIKADNILRVERQ